MEVLGDREVIIAFAASAAVVLAVLVVAIIARSVGHRGPVPLGGVAVLVGAAAGLESVGLNDGTAWLAAATTAVALGVASFSSRRLLWVVASVPGSVLAAEGATVEWHVALLVPATAVGAALLADVDSGWRNPPAGPFVLVVTILGVFLTVPDTERARVLAAAAVPLLVLSIPPGLARLGAASAGAAVMLLGWVVLLEGVGRSGAIVGAAGCLLAMALPPVVRRLIGDSPPTLALAAVHLGVVFGCSRVAGLRESAAEAAALTIGSLGIGLALLLWLTRMSTGLTSNGGPDRIAGHT